MASLFLQAGDKLHLVTSTASPVDVVIVLEGGGRWVKRIVAAETAEIFHAVGSTDIRSISIVNTHASDPVTVTPLITIASESYKLRGPTILAAGQTLSYAPEVGFVAPTSSLYNATKYVTANSVHATAATFVTITGLTFPVLLGHVYTFECHYFHIADAATTGAQFAVGGVTVTFLTAGSMSVVVPGVATTTMSSGVATAVDTAFIVQTASTTTGNVLSYAAGTIQPSASGDLLFKATSEVTVAAGLTVLKGSWASIREVDNG